MIRRWREGCLTEEVARRFSRHIGECARCRAQVSFKEMTRFENLHEGSPTHQDNQAQVRFSRVLARVVDSIAGENQRLEGERATANSLVAELQLLSPNQQRLVVGNSDRYTNWGLAEELILACRSGWSENPRSAAALAETAIQVIERLQVRGFREKLHSDLRAEAWACLANCRRIGGDLEAASAAFDTAERFLQEGTGDSIERARFFDLKASFLLASGRYESAERALSLVLAAYRSIGDAHMEGRTLLNQAKMLYDSGRVAESIPILSRAEGLIDADRDEYLGFLLKWKKLLYLVELGRNTEAACLLPEVRALAQEAPRIERLRFLWTEALLCRNLGQMDIAEQLLVQVREGFISHELPCDVAQISLDLAAIYLKGERHADVRRIASETMPLFASLQVEQELLVSWTLFQRAAEQESATLQLVDEVSRQIRGRSAAR